MRSLDEGCSFGEDLLFTLGEGFTEYACSLQVRDETVVEVLGVEHGCGGSPLMDSAFFTSKRGGWRQRRVIVEVLGRAHRMVKTS